MQTYVKWCTHNICIELQYYVLNFTFQLNQMPRDLKMLAGQNRQFLISPPINRSPSPSCFTPPQQCVSPRSGNFEGSERIRHLRSQSTSSLRNQTSLIASLRETRSPAMISQQNGYINLSAPRANTASPFNGRNRAKKRPNLLSRFHAKSEGSSSNYSPPLTSQPLQSSSLQANVSSGEEKSVNGDLPPIKPKYIKEVKSKSGITICYEPGSIRESYPYVSDL